MVAAVLAGLVGSMVVLGIAAAPPADAAQAVPGHTGLVPSTPRTNTPRISTGEIWDIEVVGTRVFIAGTFTSLQNRTGDMATVSQRSLARQRAGQHHLHRHGHRQRRQGCQRAHLLVPRREQPVPPGGRDRLVQLQHRGTANDEANLATVEITLRNTTTREQLASDGTWGPDAIAGSYRISPSNISGTQYNWTYTTPFNLSPGQYSFTVRATDDIGLTTSSANQGRLTINAQVAGDSPPNGLLNFTGTDSSIEVLHLDLAGTATDDFGVGGVRVAPPSGPSPVSRDRPGPTGGPRRRPRCACARPACPEYC